MSKGLAIMTAMSDVNPYAPPQHDVVLEAMLAHKIDKEYVWLKKVDPGYLAELPPITG